MRSMYIFLILFITYFIISNNLFYAIASRNLLFEAISQSTSINHVRVLAPQHVTRRNLANRPPIQTQYMKSPKELPFENHPCKIVLKYNLHKISAIHCARSYCKKEDKSGLIFEPLSHVHIPLMSKWFNLPHVQKFYSLHKWSKDEVKRKLSPYIIGKESIKGYIIKNDSKYIGYIQSYKVYDYPWDGHKLDPLIINNALGLDLFIGENQYLNKGYGIKIINAFTKENVWPFYRYCIVDPEVENIASINCFSKCGFTPFQELTSKDALSKCKKYILMILERPF